jgi:hypothetical protein
MPSTIRINARAHQHRISTFGCLARRSRSGPQQDKGLAVEKRRNNLVSYVYLLELLTWALGAFLLVHQTVPTWSPLAGRILFTGVGRVFGYSFVTGLLYPCLGFLFDGWRGAFVVGKKEGVDAREERWGQARIG